LVAICPLDLIAYLAIWTGLSGPLPSKGASVKIVLRPKKKPSSKAKAKTPKPTKKAHAKLRVVAVNVNLKVM
jgi:hypothetical protein